MKNIKAVFKREFKAYFDSPVAYVFMVAFLVLAGFLTFGVAMFYERRQADRTPFFFWHPQASFQVLSETRPGDGVLHTVLVSGVGDTGSVHREGDGGDRKMVSHGQLG